MHSYLAEATLFSNRIEHSHAMPRISIVIYHRQHHWMMSWLGCTLYGESRYFYRFVILQPQTFFCISRLTSLKGRQLYSSRRVKQSSSRKLASIDTAIFSVVDESSNDHFGVIHLDSCRQCWNWAHTSISAVATDRTQTSHIAYSTGGTLLRECTKFEVWWIYLWAICLLSWRGQSLRSSEMPFVAPRLLTYHSFYLRASLQGLKWAV